MNERLRRHRRLIAGSLMLLLVAALGYALRPGGSARAQPVRAVVQAHAIAPALASPASRRPARPVRHPAAASGSRRRRAAAHATRPATTLAGASITRAGVSNPPPSPGGVALALKQVTGLSPTQVTARPVCPRAAAGHASCAAQTLVLRSTGAPVRPRIVPSSGHATPAAGASASPPQPATPAYLQQAYDLTSLSQSGGANDTLAVVNAYDDPTAESDLAVYRSTYGLPACTSANGCFQKVGEAGTSSLPAPNASWEQEIALDLDAVSAICPKCHVLLVEANSSSFTDLQAAMSTAANLGAKQISASWAGVSNGVPSVLRTFSGVATVAATGDYGYVGTGQDAYPAALPGVTAAGGTSLAPATATSARGFGEAAWSWDGVTGGGSGCDLQFPRPSYQPASGCAGRAYADLSADADPSTGLAVYNGGAWSVVGGTSLSTPLIAAYYAITGVSGATPGWAYGAGGSLNDLVSGSSGSCAAAMSYICNAGPAYDGPTGMGSISGAVVAGAPGIGGPTIRGGVGTYTQSVSAHAATIAGGIYRNGADTQWWIEYGTDTNYGTSTQGQDIGIGRAPVAVTGQLSQLSPGTTYHYRLVARNSLGTTYGYDYTFTTSAAAAGAPTAAFGISPGTPAPGSTVSFDGSASTAPAGALIGDYSWNFGDSTPTVDRGANATASHSYAKRGIYTVTLTVTSNGQTDTSTNSVTVDAPPSAAFTPSASAVPAETTIAFNASHSAASAGGSIADYGWNFGDGTPAVDVGASSGASHAFTNPGTYAVTLTTTDDLSVSSTVTQRITVAAFTASPAIPAPGSPVTFTVVGTLASAGAGTNYIWDFGDGTAQQTTGNLTITHTFSTRGPYQVTVTAQTGGTGTAGGGGGGSASSAALNVDTPLTAAFSPSATTALPGSTVSFDAGASSTPGGGTIADYSWNFGDGTAAFDAGTNAKASHTFTASGIYTVTLTTTDDLGGTATASQRVTVDQPVAAFTVPTASPVANASVAFDASSSSDPASTITDYAWNFGDNTTTVHAGLSATATHSFSAAGTYTVKLTVTDQLGFTASTTQQVVISPVPPQNPNPTPPPSSSPPSSSPPPSSPPPPVASPTPSPPAAPPAGSAPPPAALMAQLTGGGRHRLAQALAHGLRVGLTVNQAASASFQITIPAWQTKLARSARLKPGATVVLGRGAWALAAGAHAITLKLPRAVAARFAASGPVVLTVRVTVTGAGGVLTRAVKLTLTR